MILLHPLQAPWFSWNMMNNKKQAIIFWLKLLHKPYMCKWYEFNHFPWCGWKQFWEARPWRNAVK